MPDHTSDFNVFQHEKQTVLHYSDHIPDPPVEIGATHQRLDVYSEDLRRRPNRILVHARPIEKCVQTTSR